MFTFHYSFWLSLRISISKTRSRGEFFFKSEKCVLKGLEWNKKIPKGRNVLRRKTFPSAKLLEKSLGSPTRWVDRIGKALPSTCGGHKCESLSHVQLFETPWMVARQAPLSIKFSRPRILEWVAIPSCRGYSQPTDQSWVSGIAGRFFTVWDTSGVAKRLV